MACMIGQMVMQVIDKIVFSEAAALGVHLIVLLEDKLR